MHSNLYPELQARIEARRMGRQLSDVYLKKLLVLFVAAFVVGAVLSGVFGINVFADLPTNLG